MPDWTKSMIQTFEFYTVDPGTWKDDKKLETVKSCTINRDLSVATLGSAALDITESLDECYMRIYLITVQNGVKEKVPLGTFIVQTQPSNHDGRVTNISVDAYTPLLELKENPPPIGYSLLKGDNIMRNAALLAQDHARAPVVSTVCDDKLSYDFVANTDDNWLSFISDLISNAKYQFDLDELGRILFSPKQDTASLQPVWTYDDGNASILYSDFDIDRDLYGIPNVVEVIYSNGRDSYYARVVNDDPNSPISTVSRGREIIHRVPNPDMSGDPTETQIKEYAQQLLRELSTLEYVVTYTHAYCPARPGDCVMFNHSGLKLINTKAKVISQSIKCEPGCPVTESAVFTSKLWR